MHTGSCHCRAVRFEIEGELAQIQVCHCGDCRKAQGGPFGTNIPVETSKFRLLSGADDLRIYESTPGKERVFCSRCGGPLFSRLQSKPEVMRVRAGTLTLVDVRPREERAMAEAPVAYANLDDGAASIEAMPKDTPIAFLCHRGGRSAQAAEHFRQLGFRDIHNVTGGIEAWADADPSVPRY